MIDIVKNIDQELRDSLSHAKEVWVAVAMITNGGLRLFEGLEKNVVQHHIVGIDLPTHPDTLERLRDLCSNNFSAKVKKEKYTFHPKLYIVKNKSGEYTAFVGSSNATNWGLKKNLELNVVITDQAKCLDLVKWYKDLDKGAIIVDNDLIEEHRKRFKKIKKLQKEIENEVDGVKEVANRSDGQFFTTEHHTILSPEYRTKNSEELKELRRKTRRRLIDLHNRIYPQFEEYGLNELNVNNRKQDRTSRSSINPFSGKTIQSIWLHYGKSRSQLDKYHKKSDKSFVNHVRMQVIIHEDSVGVWLVLGQPNGSSIDRSAFRDRMQNAVLKQRFLETLKSIKDDYWVSGAKPVDLKKIELLNNIDEVLDAEKDYEYFIIGQDFDSLDDSISDINIESTVLNEFTKLYPIYELMNSEIHL